MGTGTHYWLMLSFVAIHDCYVNPKWGSDHVEISEGYGWVLFLTGKVLLSAFILVFLLYLFFFGKRKDQGRGRHEGDIP